MKKIITLSILLTSLITQAQICVTKCSNEGSVALAANCTGGSNYSYAWSTTGGTLSGNNSATSIWTKPTSNPCGIYDINITCTDGCQVNQTRQIVIQDPIADGGLISTIDGTIQCGGFDPSTFNNDASGSGNCGNDIIYQWQISTNGGSSFTNISGASSSTYNPSAITQSTCYRRQVTTNGVCGVLDYSNQICYTIDNNTLANAGNDIVYCIGESGFISGSTSTGSGLTYLWSPVTGLSSSIVSSPNVTVNVTTTYTLTVTSSNGCTSTDQVTATVNPLPSINAGTDKNVCESSGAVLSATGGVSYVWSDGLSNGSARFPTITTTYTVTGTNSNGCVNTDQVVINVNSRPVANAGTNTVICPNDSGVVLSGSASGGTPTYSYLWTATSFSSTLQNPLVSNAGTYTLTVIDANGCQDVDTVVVTQSALSLNISCN